MLYPKGEGGEGLAALAEKAEGSGAGLYGILDRRVGEL
jgi:hypothetical protein